ncbi:MAG: VIT1/CCC1 transporter family protein [Thiohalocapsa sp.]|jgi:VIT1/CCC1 family predicted Fe2+/Mn2+ transporter|uniref:VIT1/CCC1 transporter family protein n=1 Tax=Thiohalocapsa sp. TaxID=2497641 RepID=UPI0025CD3B6A|nr:VIT1/CCC1 transporter family protein [Thiohalocapsa sp.]MCG6942085.1 VIT1/CCC1 transporter family protein [Thiohalocapsa sp.]
MPGILARIRSSLKTSAGDVVFGMEDGAVSIFGLVFGVAATTDQNAHVLVAGITGAFAAAVSMMAGVFMDRQSEKDQLRVSLEDLRALQASDPAGVTASVETRLVRTGLAPAAAAQLVAGVSARPGGLKALAEATLLPPPADGKEDSATAHALWMLVSNLFASLLPVLPFALLPLADARIASIALTTVLMFALGVWRAKLGHRHTLSTALTTLGIAAAAGAVGLLTGQIVHAWFGAA